MLATLRKCRKSRQLRKLKDPDVAANSNRIEVEWIKTMERANINTLLDKLDSDDGTLQVASLMNMVDDKDYASVPKILRLLKSPAADIRSSAAYALGYLGRQDLESVGAALMDSLDDPEEIVRSEVVEAMGELSYIRAVASIEYLLRNDASPLVRASAAESLGNLGVSEAIYSLELALLDVDEDDSVRAFSANSMGLLATEQLLPKLAEYVRAEHSLSVKAELLAAMYYQGAIEAMNQLLSLLDNADESLAINILNILTDLTEREMRSSLAEDGPDIHNTLERCARRFPILGTHAEEIVATMDRRSLREKSGF